MRIKERSIELDAIRIISMIFIVICHISAECGAVKGEYFNVGVILFLLISGYSFGGKRIENWRTYFKRRLLRILPEYYFFIIIYMLFMFVIGYSFSVRQVCVNMLLVQGLFTDLALPNVGHLWFITYILICYALTPVLHNVCMSRGGGGSTLIILVVFCIVLQIAAVPMKIVGVNLVVARFAAFIAGYYFSSRLITEKRKEKILFCRMAKYLAIPAIVCNAIRFAYELGDWRNGLPQMIDLGFRLLWQWVHCLLGVWLFCVLWILIHALLSACKVHDDAKFRIVILSQYSYCLYIVHQVFLYHDFALTRYISPWWLGLMLAFAVIIAFTLLLYKISNAFRKNIVNVIC